MDAEKENFLRHSLIPLLQEIPTDRTPLWGKMTFQQMVEHMAEYTRIASGKIHYTDIITPSESIEKVRNFLMSEKPFRENTPNPLMPEVPAPVRNPSLEEAVKELKSELDYFFNVFEENNLQVTRNPFFGDLNYEQNVQLLHKHAVHHLKQYGLNV
ncbi:MAG: DinB family protein [Flavisolibacter sp.]